MLWMMRRRFPWLGLVVVALLAAALTPPLLTGLLPRRYGQELDLTCGRVLDFEEVLGIRIEAKLRQSVLSQNYIRYLGPLPADRHWVKLWVATKPPRWLARFMPPPPAPRPGPLTDAVQELNQLLIDPTYGGQPDDKLTAAARGAIIERTLAILRQTEDPRLAFNYVRGVKRQLDDASAPLEPADLPTVEQYLGCIDQPESGTAAGRMD